MAMMKIYASLPPHGMNAPGVNHPYCG